MDSAVMEPTSPPPATGLAASDSTFLARKARKLQRIRPLLRLEEPHQETGSCYDFLSDPLRREFNIIDTENVSSNNYDPFALAIIEECRDGFVLDCGAGSRDKYYDNVVNFEICDYQSTDVRGVGERLPFKDNVFDAAFSLAVLEHVKDPFACAAEIARTLKPGGKLYCVVPFLQPLHGYPNHYYNMSHQGLKNLFDRYLEVERQEVILSGHPIWTLCWFVSRWAEGLPEQERAKFLDLKMGDVIESPLKYLDQPWVRQLPKDSRFELASTTALFARKPAAGTP
jgi:SAM-dependent methyltransferase